MLTLFANIPTRVTDIVIFLEHDKCIERPRGGWVGDDISIENSSSSTCRNDSVPPLATALFWTWIKLENIVCFCQYFRQYFVAMLSVLHIYIYIYII